MQWWFALLVQLLFSYAGHLLSGMARGMEAILSACAIGVGIAMIFRFF
ncbi:threonine/serine exporter family protein [Lacticaseibacillus paracasei]